VSGHDLSCNHNDQQLLNTMGAYIERILWAECGLLGKDTKDDDPLFSRAKKDDAGTVAHDTELISDSAMDAVINRIQAAFAKRHCAALPVAIQKVRGMDELPPALRKVARRQHLDLGKGVFYENVVYVVQQAHGTPEEAGKTIFHELYGHAHRHSVSRRVAGQAERAAESHRRRSGLYRLAAANQIDLHAYAAGLTGESRRATDIVAVGALFGGKGTLSSGPLFNEDTYKQVKPIFDSAVSHMAEAGTDLLDMMRAIINMVWTNSAPPPPAT
jgi:hypothetical protein